MRHYFIETEHKESDFFHFKESFLGKEYTFDSCTDVFSKNSIDEGTKTLLNAVIKNYDSLNGDLLDLGCGYGPIGIILKSHFKDLNVTMVDINQTAVDLAKKNVINNNRLVVGFDVFKSNLYENVNKTFDYIITNPPIKTGKKLLLELIDGAYDKLNLNGEIVLVIRKDHGADSLRKHMKSVFNNAEVIARNKGYFILKSVKEN